jgi:hypothetical protein
LWCSRATTTIRYPSRTPLQIANLSATPLWTPTWSCLWLPILYHANVYVASEELHSSVTNNTSKQYKCKSVYTAWAPRNTR